MHNDDKESKTKASIEFIEPSNSRADKARGILDEMSDRVADMRGAPSVIVMPPFGGDEIETEETRFELLLKMALDRLAEARDGIREAQLAEGTGPQADSVNDARRQVRLALAELASAADETVQLRLDDAMTTVIGEMEKVALDFQR